ncbi:MAG: 2-amino-4-hydroxy-6-hydroxymethyldihydropteridine diphosphokinase [Muribaculaceae bacterium]|nr:2-amino-4-hydroxy-6-hydroxymethyldihydropteridine diphosphokinase [Muribaculaceae bacterium]
MMKSKVILSFGSNCGMREEQLRAAISFCHDFFYNIAVSSIYETPEVHGQGDPYLNAVMRGETELTEEELSKVLKDYEYSSRRDEEARRKGVVPIDIDIVKWEDRIIRPWDYDQEFFRIGYREVLKEAEK